MLYIASHKWAAKVENEGFLPSEVGGMMRGEVEDPPSPYSRNFATLLVLCHVGQ